MESAPLLVFLGSVGVALVLIAGGIRSLFR
jgi:hypothetical protein